VRRKTTSQSMNHQRLEEFWSNCQGVFTGTYWWPD